MLVVYENSDEKKVAEKLAAAGRHALAIELDWIVSQLNTHRPPFTMRAMSYRELFSGATEYERSAYVQALERSVFVGDELQ